MSILSDVIVVIVAMSTSVGCRGTWISIEGSTISITGISTVIPIEEACGHSDNVLEGRRIRFIDFR
jgi:hypothetical protein